MLVSGTKAAITGTKATVKGISAGVAVISGTGRTAVVVGGTISAGGAITAVGGIGQAIAGGIMGSNTLESFGKDINKLIQDSSGGNGSGNWNKGSFNSEQDSLNRHFSKHGGEVGAKTPEEYLRKAEEFAKNAKKVSTKSKVAGDVDGVIRYKKNGKYIDIAPDGSIISFGKQ